MKKGPHPTVRPHRYTVLSLAMPSSAAIATASGPCDDVGWPHIRRRVRNPTGSRCRRLWNSHGSLVREAALSTFGSRRRLT
jgi:hypothetical protein